MFHYSITSLLVGVMNAVLFVSTLDAFAADKSPDAVARGGLSFCTLCFSLVCSVTGHPPIRTFTLCAGFYAWGFGSVYLAETIDLALVHRFALAIIGPAYALWAWLAWIVPD